MREDRGGETVLNASASHQLLCLAEIAGFQEVSGKRLTVNSREATLELTENRG
jgi:hypothetical protein